MCTSSPVASAPTILLLTQIFDSTVRVYWNKPSRGATITGYVVHYSNGSTYRNKTLSADLTVSFIKGLKIGLTYTISVEATSEHLSAESDKMNITLG